VELPSGSSPVVRTPPPDLHDADVVAAVAGGWYVSAQTAAYVPEGGGSHHWQLTDAAGQPVFVTVDDLDDKDWMADNREAVFDGLRRALTSAASLRETANLEFVVAPIRNNDGEVVQRLGSRYALAVYPYVTGESFPFGRHADPNRRQAVLDMLVRLHRHPTDIGGGDRPPTRPPDFGGRRVLALALDHPDEPWGSGPYADGTRTLVAQHRSALAELVQGFDRLVEVTASSPAELVITHGEPHAGNVMRVDNRFVLIDWDTVAMGQPERDLWLVISDQRDRSGYEAATGRPVDPNALVLYRLRWYLDDVASAVRMFRQPHRRTEDTERWWAELAPRLQELPEWQKTLAGLSI